MKLKRIVIEFSDKSFAISRKLICFIPIILISALIFTVSLLSIMSLDLDGWGEINVYTQFLAGLANIGVIYSVYAVVNYWIKAPKKWFYSCLIQEQD